MLPPPSVAQTFVVLTNINKTNGIVLTKTNDKPATNLAMLHLRSDILPSLN